MATTPTRLMTFAEFAELPDPAGGKYELRHGELVFMAPPNQRHFWIQNRLMFLLQEAAGRTWMCGTEMPFRPLPEIEGWFADVGLIAASRVDRASKTTMSGAPELVVEVLSPSNRMSEIVDRMNTCFRGGAQAFWLVDAERQTVEVYSPSNVRPELHSSGDSIPLFFGGTLAVDEIFS
jgi:Uma2 family endonuclease